MNNVSLVTDAALHPHHFQKHALKNRPRFLLRIPDHPIIVFFHSCSTPYARKVNLLHVVFFMPIRGGESIKNISLRN